MKKIAVSLAVAGMAASSAYAAPENYRIDPDHCMPTFEIPHLGFSTQRGRFDRAGGNITLDLAAKTGSVDFTVFVSSLDMGSGAWNAHLLDEGLFNVFKFPTATYRSQHLVFEGDKVVAADGEFTLIGVTKPLRVIVSGFRCGLNPVTQAPVCGGDITATLKRSDFGLTKYIPAVSDEVTVKVPIEAYKQ